MSPQCRLNPLVQKQHEGKAPGCQGDMAKRSTGGVASVWFEAGLEHGESCPQS
jgi:hypothetical protein